MLDPALPQTRVDIDTPLTRRQPSWIALLAGAIAGLVPFFLYIVVTANGCDARIKPLEPHFERGDRVALAGGAIALVCGLFAFVFLGLPNTARRGHRALLAVAVVAIAVVQVLRGAGVIGVAPMPVDAPAAASGLDAATQHAVAVKAREILAVSSHDEVRAIYAEAHPKHRETVTLDALERLFETAARQFGRFGDLGEVSYEHGRFEALEVVRLVSMARFERGLVRVEIDLVPDHATMRLLSISLHPATLKH